MLKPRFLLTLICLFAATSLCAQEAYRGVDKYGNPVFSDRPFPGGEKVQLRQPNRSPASAKAKQAETRNDQTAGDGYSSIRISQPAGDETVTDADGSVTVTVATEPGLRRGHTIRLLLDDSARPDQSRNGLFELNNVAAGQHRLRARVVDEHQETVIESATVTFRMQRSAEN